MIDAYTLEQCKKDEKVLQIKITNIQHAIKQSEAMIVESKMDDAALAFLRRKIADSLQDLEVLYLVKQEQKEFGK
ncbi:hypothetical protein [Prochlorococcus sp. MIT 1307]|uniref:hypothetical protein n=1 Tax=Prochlorococcus sp. MIT 1307 TaxID=3096219 RepID=UPI002A757621|nr:hypothetical protein [Prochlorococcus sp. MIT 1307]